MDTLSPSRTSSSTDLKRLSSYQDAVGQRWPRRSIATVIQVLVTVALLLLLVYLVDVGQAISTIRSAQTPLVLAGLAVVLAGRVLKVVKWYYLARVQVPNLRLWPSTRAYMASVFASLFLPTSIGSDVLRAVALGRRIGRVPEIGASILAERHLGILANAAMVFAALVLVGQAPPNVEAYVTWAAVVFLLGGLAAVVPLWVWERLRATTWGQERPSTRWLLLLGRFAEAYDTYRRHRALIAGVALLTLAEQFVPILALWLLAFSASLAVSVEMVLVAVPLALFVARLPVSFAGIGVAEAGLVYFLSQFGVAPADALALALLGRAADLIAMLPGALWLRDLSGASASSSSSRPGGSSA